MVKVLVGKVKTLSQSEINSTIAPLSAEALARLEKKNETLRTQSLCALSLLKKLVGEETFSRASLKYEENGRPYFEDLDIDISLSHTDSYVACAISDKRSSRVGIDAETKAITDDEAKKIAHRFFSVGEQDILNKSENVKQAFLEIWTKKEALKKHLDDGRPLLSLDTSEPESFGVEFISRTLPNGALTVCAKKGEVCDIKFLK